MAQVSTSVSIKDRIRSLHDSSVNGNRSRTNSLNTLSEPKNISSGSPVVSPIKNRVQQINSSTNSINKTKSFTSPNHSISSFKIMPRVEMSAPSDNETVRKILDINNEIRWAVFKYDKNQIQTIAEGSGDVEDLKQHLDEGEVLYGYMRFQLGTDKRNKFVFIKWVGENARPLQRARALDDCKRVQDTVKVYHIEVPATKKTDLNEQLITDRLQKAAGANYDKEQNANPAGTQSVLGLNSYKSSSKQFFQNIEKNGNLQKVVYETKALPKTTPVDLTNRQMTAAAADAKKNMIDLNTKKSQEQSM